MCRRDRNYTDYEIPYTRIIEHKHFEFGVQPKTVITREYPAVWERGREPYYPVNDPKNNELFDKYELRAREEKNVLFGGRLGMYRYMDRDAVIEEALNLAETELVLSLIHISQASKPFFWCREASGKWE